MDVLRPTPQHFPLSNQSTCFLLGRPYTACNTVCILARPSDQWASYLSSAHIQATFRGFLGDLLGSLAGYRPRRRPRYLLCGNLVGDIKDHDEPASDLGIGDLRIDLIVDLLLACRSACYLASWPVAQQGRPFTKQCILTYAE